MLIFCLVFFYWFRFGSKISNFISLNLNQFRDKYFLSQHEPTQTDDE